MMVGETISMQWPEEGYQGIAVSFNVNFPVKVIENQIYSLSNYIEAIGGQYSVLITIVTFFA